MRACDGRFTREMRWAEVVAFSRGLELVVPPDDPLPAWNVCPTQSNPVVLPTAGSAAGAHVEAMRGGLLPPWARDAKLGASMINARLETVSVKPAYRNAWKARRCLTVPLARRTDYTGDPIPGGIAWCTHPVPWP